ncbi:MAG: UDP-3-O-[3-hydroxymyristoyl] N-acetylglucosamine deacetylase [Candidatus Pelagibacter sp.]|nr:UDP-3-O-[3-hydroxymyristoyl] N-acetylglucosamine deacetylase [Candidatus Pelagibacter sp.]OUW24235.1 MAG: UDP-3-O-[3-hydroxymyristoyl] N-acetylglucosamine deacetylase [Rickettsiales bacterium TMED174]
MLNIYQKTLSKKASFKGIGLHSGKIAEISLIPSAEDTGITFKRTDIKDNNLIKANFQNVSSTNLCTVIKNQHGVSISTVEHLVAALYFTGVDNLEIQINNSEIPIMDGSAKDFVKIINKAGVKNQTKKRKYLKISKEVKIHNKNKFINLTPQDQRLKVNYELDYENKIISNQKNIVDLSSDNLEDIYSSRTFCLYKDIQKIKEAGLAKGGSLNNAIVVDDNKIINEGGLRNEKEFVNHKILDLAGDLFLAGHRILGHVKTKHGGHELNKRCLDLLFSDKNNYELFEVTKPDIRKENFIIRSEKIAAIA